MEQSKIVKAQKKLNDQNVQETWTKDGTTYYKAYYEMENGDKGDASHKSENPKYKISDEVVYEKKVNAHGTYFTGMKLASSDYANGGGGGRKGSYMSQDQSLRSTCINTIFVLRNTSPELNLKDAAANSEALFEAMKPQAADKGDAMMLQSSMKIAREQNGFTSLTDYIATVSHVYKYMKGE